MFQLTLFPWFIHCSLHLNFMASNLIIDVGQVFLRQIFAVADATVQSYVLLFGHLALHLRRVQVCS